MPAGPLLVLDTNVVLDWIVFEDPSVTALVEGVRTGALRVVTSEECLAELRRVLNYPQFKLPAAGQVAAYRRYVEYAATAEDPRPGRSGLPTCPDPDDQKFLELAWSSQADYLLTKDKTLLKMARKVASLGRFAVMEPGRLNAIER